MAANARHDGSRHSRLNIVIAVLIAIVLTMISIGAAFAEPDHNQATRARLQRLADVKSWGYQLRAVDTAHVAASPFDLVVVDYARGRSQFIEHPFTREEVAQMQARPDGGNRLMIAYLSIGEAEWYRYYWKSGWEGSALPAWIGTMNPQWYGNFPVRFWSQDWQRILFEPDTGYLARILAAGFDGIYLDRADVYEDWTKERPSARADMVVLLARIRAEVDRIRPGTLVIQQNAEELLTAPQVRRAIDAIAKENLVYGVDAPEARNKPDEIAWSERHLNLAAKSGRKVFVVEYLDDPALAADARKRIEKGNFIATFTARPLHVLPYQPVDQLAERAVWPPVPRGFGPLHAPRPPNY